MFKKPVIVATANNIKGIGCRGWLAPRVLAIRLAVREGKKRICGSAFAQRKRLYRAEAPQLRPY